MKPKHYFPIIIILLSFNYSINSATIKGIVSNSRSVSEFVKNSGHINSHGEKYSTGMIPLKNFRTLNKTRIKWFTTGQKVYNQSKKDSVINIPQATNQKIIETRQGHKSCWGVLIQLDKLSFNKTIKASELSIIEQKHGHELKNIMVWRVDKSRHKLIIKFKKGCGDFGSGNFVDVKIKSSAIFSTHSEDIKLSISTDI